MEFFRIVREYRPPFQKDLPAIPGQSWRVCGRAPAREISLGRWLRRQLDALHQSQNRHAGERKKSRQRSLASDRAEKLADVLRDAGWSIASTKKGFESLTQIRAVPKSSTTASTFRQDVTHTTDLHNKFQCQLQRAHSVIELEKSASSEGSASSSRSGTHQDAELEEKDETVDMDGDDDKK